MNESVTTPAAQSIRVYEDEKEGGSFVVCGSEYRELLRLARDHVSLLKQLFQMRRTAGNPDWAALYWDSRQGLTAEDARTISTVEFSEGLGVYRVLDTGHRCEEIPDAGIIIRHHIAEVTAVPRQPADASAQSRVRVVATIEISSIVEMYHDPSRRALVVHLPACAYEFVCYDQAVLRAMYYCLLLRHDDASAADPISHAQETIAAAQPRLWSGDTHTSPQTLPAKPLDTPTPPVSQAPHPHPSGFPGSAHEISAVAAPPSLRTRAAQIPLPPSRTASFASSRARQLSAPEQEQQHLLANLPQIPSSPQQPTFQSAQEMLPSQRQPSQFLLRQHASQPSQPSQTLQPQQYKSEVPSQTKIVSQPLHQQVPLSPQPSWQFQQQPSQSPQQHSQQYSQHSQQHPQQFSQSHSRLLSAIQQQFQLEPRHSSQPVLPTEQQDATSLLQHQSEQHPVQEPSYTSQQLSHRASAASQPLSTKKALVSGAQAQPPSQSHDILQSQPSAFQGHDSFVSQRPPRPAEKQGSLGFVEETQGSFQPHPPHTSFVQNSGMQSASAPQEHSQVEVSLRNARSPSGSSVHEHLSVADQQVQLARIQEQLEHATSSPEPSPPQSQTQPLSDQ